MRTASAKFAAVSGRKNLPSTEMAAFKICYHVRDGCKRLIDQSWLNSAWGFDRLHRAYWPMFLGGETDRIW
jgi:hypothetical protein